MKRAGILGVVLMGMIAGWLLRDVADHADVLPRKGTGSPKAAGSAHLPPAAVLAVTPRGSQPPASVTSRLSPTFREHIAARNYASEFAHLASLKTRTPEEQWVYARIMEFCGRVVDPEVQRVRTPYPNPSEDQARERFIRSLADDDPDRDKRIAAYDLIPRHRCDGVEAAPISRKDWRGLMQAAADGGEPKARIELVEDEIAAQYRARMASNDVRLVEISAAQLDAMKQAVASGDPFAIERGLALLSGNYANLSLRDGQGQAIDLEALRSAGELVSCDAGYPCGDANPFMAFQCAFVGQCGTSNYRDFTMFYRASPYTSQLIAQYEQSLREAAANGDWSGFRFDSGPPTFRGTIR